MKDVSSGEGSLVCIGIGMTLGAHISIRARNHIEQADVVFAGVSDSLVEEWIASMHSDVRSLQPYYAEGKNRRESYQGMVEAMLTEVRAGKRVCGAFYGHPAVFALPPRHAVQIAREEGYSARIEAGVSAADCLYADLEIDPGQYGCQHFETSQLMLYERRIDSSATLILWQAGLAGDRSLTRFQTEGRYRQLLVDLLRGDYPAEHPVTIYRAPVLPIHAPRIEHTTLQELATADIDMHDTLVLRPSVPMRRNQRMQDWLDVVDGERHTSDAQSQACQSRRDTQP